MSPLGGAGGCVHGRKEHTPDGQSTQTPRSRWDTPPSTPPQHTAAMPRFFARARGHNMPTHNEKPARRASRSHTADKREKTRRGAPGPRNRALPAWPHPPHHSSTACQGCHPFGVRHLCPAAQNYAESGPETRDERGVK
eukprot:scaffold13411_cov105-Isochrysis_galbana.AAC.3